MPGTYTHERRISIVHKITNTDKSENLDEMGRAVSRSTQESVHTALDYALKAQEINTELLRRTSQAWIGGFRFQARLSQEMTQAFFGRWAGAFASTTHVERPTQEQGRSEVTEPATNGTQKDIEVAGEDGSQKAEKQSVEEVARETRKAEETQKATDIAAKDAQKNPQKADFPIGGYDEMNVGEVSERLDGLSVGELKRVRKYEKENKNRWSLRKVMKQKIKTTS